MDDDAKDRAIWAMTDFERQALMQKDGWATVPTRVFGTQPEHIPNMWATGLVEVYWSPRAHLIKQRRNERD